MNKCLKCGFWNNDYEGCTCPSYDKWYACPIESEKPENKKALEEYAKQELKMAVTKTFKVYGRDGHRQKESFNESYRYDFSSETEGVRILEVENSDKTGTNEYSLVRITRNTEDEVYDELNGQISDGIFENSFVGRVEEVVEK